MQSSADSAVKTPCHGPEYRFSFEERPPWFRGPQNACHPDALEFSLCESGIGFGQIADEQAPITRGQCVLIAPGVEHSSWTAEHAVRECNAHFPWESVARTAEEMGFERLDVDRIHFAPIPVPKEILHIVRSLRTALGGRPDRARQLLLDSLALALLAGITRLFASAEVRSRPSSRRDRAFGLRRVESLLRESPEEEYTLEQLAQLAGLSRFHFVRSFKQAYGLPPHAFQTKLRVDSAAELIRTTGRSLTEIAFDLGFGSSSRFSQAFKKRFGCAPSIWRQQYFKADAAMIA